MCATLEGRVLRPGGREGRVEEREREQLVDSLLDRLRTEGAPQGVWLVEIAQARDQLASIDSLLRRLAAAIVDQMSP